MLPTSTLAIKTNTVAPTCCMSDQHADSLTRIMRFKFGPQLQLMHGNCWGKATNYALPVLCIMQKSPKSVNSSMRDRSKYAAFQMIGGGGGQQNIAMCDWEGGLTMPSILHAKSQIIWFFCTCAWKEFAKKPLKLSEKWLKLEKWMGCGSQCDIRYLNMYNCTCTWYILSKVWQSVTSEGRR